MWRGIDGSEILTYFLTAKDYKSPGISQLIMQISRPNSLWEHGKDISRKISAMIYYNIWIW